MLPSDWRDGKVGDLLQGLESGVSVNGEDRLFSEEEKAVLKVSAVSYGKFNAKAAKVIETEELDRAKTNPKKGQIILSRSNTEDLVGASAYIPRDFPNLFLPDKLWQTLPKPDSDMKWLSYVLASNRARYTLSNLATGTSGSMKNITKGELLGLKILIPPLPEQKKIAQILSTWDKAIATTEKLLANSQQQKKALMQQLLTGKKRLLDKNGVRFSGEWVDYKLLSLASPEKDGFTDGDWIESPYITDKGCRLIQTGNIGIGEFRNKSKKYISEASFVELKCTEVTTGDLLICRLAEPAGRACVVPDLPDEKMLTSVDVAILKVDPLKSSANYLSFYFSLDKTLYDVSALCGGSTRSRVSRTNLGKMNIKLPTLAEQVAIVSLINASQTQIEKMEGQLQELNEEKKALMQQLLTGKRRVKTDEVPA